MVNLEDLSRRMATEISTTKAMLSEPTSESSVDTTEPLSIQELLCPECDAFIGSGGCEAHADNPVQVALL